MRSIRSQRSAARQGGIALLLVVFAVGMATILCVSFLSAQSTVTQIAENIEHQTQARFIAESGMKIAIKEITGNTTWRDDYANGDWITDSSLHGGTFTVTVEDGTDTDGDGVVEGDGDLTNDANEPATITVRGSFEGVTHLCRAVVTGSEEYTLEAETISVSDKVEVKEDGFIDSWDSSAGSYASSKGNNAVVTTNSTSKDKIKVKNNGVIGGDVFVGPKGKTGTVVQLEGSGTITGSQDKLLEKVTIPGVELPSLGASIGDYKYYGGIVNLSTNIRCNKFELSGNTILNVSGDVTVLVEKELKLKDSAQIRIGANSTLTIYIGTKKIKQKLEGSSTINADSNDPGRFFYYSASKEKLEVKKTAQVYGAFVMPSAELKIKDDGQVFGVLRGKKLKLEDDGQFHHDIVGKKVIAADVYIDLGGSDYGAAAADKIEIKGSGRVYSLSGKARISTNETYSGAIKVKESGIIDGAVDVYVGPEGTPGSTITVEDSGEVNGATGTLDHSVTIPDVSEPTIATLSSDIKVSSGKTIISSDMRVNNFWIWSSGIVEINGDVNIVVENEVWIGDSGELQIKGNGSLNLYLINDIDVHHEHLYIGGSAKVNTDRAKPDQLHIYTVDCHHAEFKGSSETYAHVIAPYDDVKIKDSGKLYGTVRAYKIKIEGSGELHLGGGTGEGQPETGEAVGAAAGVSVQWIENP